jgi:hypothetical protein
MSNQQINRAVNTLKWLEAAAEESGFKVEQLVAVYNAQVIKDAVEGLGSDLSSLESTLSSSLA